MSTKEQGKVGPSPEELRRKYRSRILGNCPSCSSEDTLFTHIKNHKNQQEDFHKVCCTHCNNNWPDSWRLEREETEKGNPLILVNVTHWRTYAGKELGVVLESPLRREIPQSTLVSSVLNSALITKFGLDVCFATEGGVEGRYERSYISLINSGDLLGLHVESDYYQKQGLSKVLNFYEKMLRTLFEEPLQCGNKKYRPGEILRLSKEEQTPDNAWEIMKTMLEKTGGKDFPKNILDCCVKNSQNPFSAPYIKGLTNEEIVKRFVPPPNLE